MDHRLKKEKQFSYIFKKGKRTSCPLFTLFSVPSKFACYKIGYSISKKVGKANKRNKLKRRLREIVRTCSLPKPYFNYVILARQGAAELDYQTLKKQICELFERWKSFFFHSNLSFVCRFIFINILSLPFFRTFANLFQAVQIISLQRSKSLAYSKVELWE